MQSSTVVAHLQAMPMTKLGFDWKLCFVMSWHAGIVGLGSSVELIQFP